MVVASAGLVLTSLAWSPSSAARVPAKPAALGAASFAGDHLWVYSGVVDQRGLNAIVAMGVDRHELQVEPVARRSARPRPKSSSAAPRPNSWRYP